MQQRGKPTAAKSGAEVAEGEASKRDCRVCGDPIYVKDVCNRCYQRERLGLPEQPRTRIRRGARVQLTVGVDEGIAELVKTLAANSGIAMNQWLKEAIDQKLDRELEAMSPKKER